MRGLAIGVHVRDDARFADRRIPMIKGLAHTGVCVPDVEAAVAWYRDVLGLAVLSPPYLMEGDALHRDMGELVPDPRMKAAGESGTSRALTDHGLSHVALLCDDIDATRAMLEARGVRFLVTGVADVARLRTTWFVDPWNVTFILIEKTRPQRPYYAQWG
jgi:catechol 2,3-dioxygenase-like lactoylglutathione lyase family enzyme